MKVKLARVAAGMTQPELAKAIGVRSSAYISMIERGERTPSLGVFKRLYEVLDISDDDDPIEDDRGSAPVSSMTLREYYAGLAMQGLLVGKDLETVIDLDGVIVGARECADELIYELRTVHA